MNLQTKALYNLLRLNYAADSTLPVENWQIADYRAIPVDELFQKLNRLGISLDKERFEQFSKECDSPEDLSELLLSDQDPKLHDPVYLILFELWRKSFPERPSLSIFCDELDERISLYDAGKLESDEPIQDALSNLVEILDENIDAGAEPSAIFETISSFCAHDLIGFIIDFISDVINSGNSLYASELIEDFASFTDELIWFDFLRARIVALTDPVQANGMISELLKHDDMLTVDILLEMLRFQTSYGERLVFAATIKKLISRLQTEEEFKEMLEISSEYFRRRDREDLDLAVQNLLSKRKKKSGDVRSSDPDLKVFEKLIPSNE